jgi:hypothetical protein
VRVAFDAALRSPQSAGCVSSPPAGEFRRRSKHRLLEVQARLLGQHLLGEIAELPAVEPR